MRLRQPRRTVARSPRPKRRAIARCARGWSRSGEECRASIPIGGTRRCRRSATARRGWRSSASRPASTARTAPAGRSPAIMPASCSTRRLLKFGLAEASIAPTRRRAAAHRRDHPQRRQMPAAGEQAGAARDRDLPQLFRSRARLRCRTCGCWLRSARSPMSPPRARSGCRRRRRGSAMVRRRTRPTGGSCCRAIIARATTRTPAG